MSISSADASKEGFSGLLAEILTGLKSLQKDNAQLASAVDAINGRVNMLAGVKQVHEAAAINGTPDGPSAAAAKEAEEAKSTRTVKAVSEQYERIQTPSEPIPRRSSISKITLTSYPGQAGVDPINMNWGHPDPDRRGPVVVSRHPNTIRRRNGESASAQPGSY